MIYSSAPICEDFAFTPLTADEALVRFEDDLKSLDFMQQDARTYLQNLGQQLINLVPVRSVKETVTLQPFSAYHSVSLTFPDSRLNSGTSPAAGTDSPQAYLLAKRSKLLKFRELTIDDTGFRTLSFRETQALLFLTASAFTRDVTGRTLTPADKIALTNLIISTTPDAALLNRVFSNLTGILASKQLTGPQNRLWDLLNAIHRTRPFILMEDLNSPPSHRTKRNASFSFSERAYVDDAVGNSVWRRLKSHVASRLDFSRRADLEFALDRALESDSFSFDVKAPEGLYFHTAELWDVGPSPRAIRSMNSDGHARAFATLSLSSQATHVKASLAMLSETDIRAPLLTCRLEEIPPGSRGKAALIAVSSFFATWICASLYPRGDAASVDLAAVILTVPGAAGAFLAAKGSLRRRTASVASTFIIVAASISSVLALTLYLAFGANRFGTHPDHIWGTMSHTVAYIDNWMWLVLFLFNLLLALVASSRVLTSMWRYRQDLDLLTRKETH
ncbi:MAG: hypothetical protein GX454_04135 [Brooklawnia sp.]|nr:hypothetical protein [Brooklawnia sp.]